MVYRTRTVWLPSPLFVMEISTAGQTSATSSLSCKNYMIIIFIVIKCHCLHLNGEFFFGQKGECSQLENELFVPPEVALWQRDLSSGQPENVETPHIYIRHILHFTTFDNILKVMEELIGQVSLAKERGPTCLDRFPASLRKCKQASKWVGETDYNMPRYPRPGSFGLQLHLVHTQHT